MNENREVWTATKHCTFQHKFSIFSSILIVLSLIIGCGRNSTLSSNCNDEPQLINKVEPEYPRMAREAGLEGVVRLDFAVDRNGNVSNIEIVTSGIASLDEAARFAVSQYKYIPACYMGRPIESHATTVIEFLLE